MDAADLRVFEAVARLGGMNRAAGALNTVQSNVTARIRLLEDELETKLFRRHSRGVTLTPAGTRLLPYAERAAQLFDEARRAVRDDGAPGGPLLIGSLETAAAQRLSPLLAAYAARYPAVDVTLATGTSVELVNEVLARRLEGAFVCGPAQHPELVAEPVFHETLTLVTRPSVKSLAAALAAPDLRIVVLRRGCSYRQRLEELLARRGVVGLRLLEFGTIDGILGCAAAGLGITLLPRALVEPARRAGRVAVHALPAPEAEVDTVFIRRRDGFVSSALAAFLDGARAPRAAAAE